MQAAIRRSAVILPTLATLAVWMPGPELATTSDPGWIIGAAQAAGHLGRPAAG
jgi:hypothetical protein